MAPVPEPLLEPLTAREEDVLAVVARGLSNPEIAIRALARKGDQ